MSVYSDSWPKLDLGIRPLAGVKEFIFFFQTCIFCRYPSGYKLLDLVLIEADKLEVDPSLPNPPGNKEFRNFYSKCANDNKASKCRTFASYSSLLQQFKCSPPLKQIALPWSLTRLFTSCWKLYYALSLTGKMRMKMCFSRMTECYHWTPTLTYSANSFPRSSEELVRKAEF